MCFSLLAGLREGLSFQGNLHLVSVSVITESTYLGFTRPISRHVLLYRRDRMWKCYPPFSKLPALSCLSILLVWYYRIESSIRAATDKKITAVVMLDLSSQRF